MQRLDLRKVQEDEAAFILTGLARLTRKKRQDTEHKKRVKGHVDAFKRVNR
jgi:hypothetical protein